MSKAIRSLSRYDRELGRTLAEVEIPPAVIDLNMIREEVVKIAPKGLVGSTFKAFYKIESVDRLALERLNILQIDNLWMLKKITTLSLANNLISKIENLDTLVTLVDLNLSFNKIQKIENLESLVNLERLSLYHNKITEVENLEALSKLCILSIGGNLIQDKHCVLYLRKIESLRSVNLDGNPCSEEEGFREYSAAFLPQVVYLGYNLVSAKERLAGKTLFQKEYTDVVKAEKIEASETKVEREREKRKQFLKLSYVDQLEGEEMYEALFKDDVDGQALMILQDKLQDIFDSLRTDITKLSSELFKVGQKEYKRRCEEHDDFISVLEAAKETGSEQSRSLLKEFDEFQGSCVGYLESVTSHFDKRRNKGVRMVKLGRLCSFYEEYYRRYWLALIGREVFLHDQIEDLISQFEGRMGEQVGEFIEKAMGFFTLMRDAEMNYFEALSDRTLKYLANVTAKEGVNLASFLPFNVIQILRDKETVNNAVGTSHDVHLLVIDTTEDTVVSSINTWFKDLVQKYSQNEIDRNRRCVLELINYLEGQHTEFMKQYNANYKACKELYTFVKKSLKARVRNFADVDELEERRPTLALHDEAKPSDLATLLGAKIHNVPVTKSRPKKKKVVIVLPEKDEEKKMDDEVDLFLSNLGTPLRMDDLKLEATPLIDDHKAEATPHVDDHKVEATPHVDEHKDEATPHVDDHSNEAIPEDHPRSSTKSKSSNKTNLSIPSV